jgi:hypothetical protein
MQLRTQRVSLLCSRGLNISTRSSPFKLHAFCSSAAATAMELLQHAHPSSSYSRRTRDICKHLLPCARIDTVCPSQSTEQASPFHLASGIIHFGNVQRRPYSRMKYFPLLPGKMRLFLSFFCDFCKKNSI